MLEKIQIQNFALIKNLEINLTNGFNVLVGETGAGKSIIISAINFLLGGKADKTQIRSGEEQAKVVGVFSVSKSTQEKLKKFDVEDETIVISRSFSLLGKNEIKINGNIESLAVLRQIGALFLDSYNQNEQVELKKSKNHLVLLDSYKPALLFDLKNQLSELIKNINDVDSSVQKYGGDEKSRARKIDMLQFQIDEIEQANIKDGEIEEISLSLSKISSAEKVLNAISNLKDGLTSDNSMLFALNSAKNQIANINSGDKTLEELYSRLESVAIELEDISESLNQISEEYSFDEMSVNELILRREKLENLRHKYGSTYAEIQEFLLNSKSELNDILNAEEILKELESKRDDIKRKIYDTCEKISSVRKACAKEIEVEMQKGLKDVGIKNSKFLIVFSPYPSYEEFNNFSEEGFDDVEFMFSANLGEELKPLSKTISGGEMSRFMLVLKNIIAKNEGMETIIFDEIDTGISGEIADKVALKIEELSKIYQIICITHLPQVASKGDNFIRVFKNIVQGRTETLAEVLDESQVTYQIAKMASGFESQGAIDYAKELRMLKK